MCVLLGLAFDGLGKGALAGVRSVLHRAVEGVDAGGINVNVAASVVVVYDAIHEGLLGGAGWGDVALAACCELGLCPEGFGPMFRDVRVASDVNGLMLGIRAF